MESRFKVSCAGRYTLNTGGEGKCKKQKEMGEREREQRGSGTVLCEFAILHQLFSS